MEESVMWNGEERYVEQRRALCGIEKSVMWNREESYVDNKT